MQQILFDFARSYLSDSWDRLDTFVAGANASVLRLLRDWLDNPGAAHAYVFGGRSSGCSRLLHASCRHMLEQGHHAAVIASPLALLDGMQMELVEHNNLLVLDDLETIATTSNQADTMAIHRPVIEEALYELFDRAADRRCALLFASHVPAGRLAVSLPDLRTRMLSCLQLGLRPLDDKGLEQLAHQLLLECGVHNIPPDLGKLVLTYCQRDSANVVGFIRTMLHASLDEKKSVSVRFVHKYLRSLDPVV